MKRGTPEHPKTHELAARLKLEKWGAVGVLEALFHFAAQYARRGDIGRRSDEAIARGIGWSGDAPGLIEALVASGWLDRCRCHRLRIHDWPEHADQTVSRSAEVKKSGFIECYEDASATLVPIQRDASQPLPLPLPLPTPLPKPEPTPLPAADAASDQSVIGERRNGRPGVQSTDRPFYLRAIWDTFAAKFKITREPTSAEMYLAGKWADRSMPLPVVLEGIAQTGGVARNLAACERAVEAEHKRVRTSLGLGDERPRSVPL